MRQLKPPCIKFLPSRDLGLSDRTKKNRCMCTISRREETIASSFRMVARAMIALFLLCLVLFIWNISLWRDLVKLQGQVVTLTKVLKQVKSSQNEVTSSLEKNLDDEEPDNNFQTTPQTHVENSWNENNFLSRERRNVFEEENAMARENPRPRRERKRKSRKKKGRKGRQVPRPQNLATAIHVRIQGTHPYRGMLSDDSILHNWETHPELNQGFDISQINLGNGKAGVIVKKTGIYYIYSQVVVKMNRNSEIHEKIMIGYLGNSELTACSNSFPEERNEDDYITCYTSGVAFLRKNDKFRIKIFPSDLEVFTNPTHTYFGAFFLGEKE